MMLRNFLWVGLGGGIGAMLRFLILFIFRNGVLPLSTIMINIAGSFFIGLILALSTRNTDMSEQLKLFLITGICGGFTTFSAFSAENLQLLRTGNYALAAVNIVLSVAGGLVAVFAGYRLVAGRIF